MFLIVVFPHRARLP